MKSQDIRWIQRFENFQQAFTQIKEALAIDKQRPFTKLEKQGLIQAFEFTHELGWNVLKDYLEHYGHHGLVGSRDTAGEAFKRGLVQDGEAWMEMIKSRNQTSHTYNQKISDEIVDKIKNLYFKAFLDFEGHFKKLTTSG